MFCVISIFGVDAINVTFYQTEQLARQSILENLKMCSENNIWEIEEKNNGVYFIVNKSENDPTNYVEFVLTKTN